MSTVTLWDGREVPRIGMGCWAIGGPTLNAGPATSYGKVDDTASRAALRAGYEMGVRVFDTAAGYGAGHSEVLLGEEISQFADAVIITKFGFEVDHEARLNGPVNVTPDGIRIAIDNSRGRLRRDRLDLVFLHVNEMEIEIAASAFDTLDSLVAEGKIGKYGWSTDFVDRAAAFADRTNFVAVENDFNVFTPASELMELCAQKGLVSISRLPLAMGLLTGKFRPNTELGDHDVRGQAFEWLTFFDDGRPNAEYLRRLEGLRELLQSDGRSLAQGALGWILAKSAQALPVPGFKSEAQVRDNFGANEKGPLSADVMAEIDTVLQGFEGAQKGG